MPSPDLAGAVKRLPLVEAALFILAALFALQFHLRLPSRLPAEEDYRRVAEVLASEARPGDAVLLHPWWTERARLFLPERVPVVGYLDDEADPLERYPRIWVLAQPDLPLAGNGRFQAAFSPHRDLAGPQRRFGTLALALYENRLYRPALFSATEALASARVYVEQPGGARVDCPGDGRQFRCPVGRDLHVAAEWHELFYKPQRCLWMHPPGGDARLVVEFPSLPAGRLRLEGGIVWEHAWHHDDRTPLAIVAESAQTAQALARVDVAVGREGFLAADATLPAPAPVRIWTQSANDNERDACVELRVLGPSAAEGR